VRIHVADAATGKRPALNEFEYFGVTRHGRLGQLMKQIKHQGAVLNTAASQFAGNKGMPENVRLLQQ
jgi:hypothetical protein